MSARMIHNSYEQWHGLEVIVNTLSGFTGQVSISITTLQEIGMEYYIARDCREDCVSQKKSQEDEQCISECG